jgi:PAS domain S-box-containing protein
LLLEKSELKIRNANPAITEMLEYSNEELIGKNLEDIGFPDDLGTSKEIMQSLDKDGIIHFVDMSLEKKSGQVIETDMYMVDKARLVQCNIRDVTERVKLQAQLIQAQKMESVGRLAGGVAHDYNNALSVIIGFTELAMEKIDPAEPPHADLSEVLKAARHATDITRQLLAFARKQIVAPVVLDLNDNIEAMLKMLRRLIGEDIDLAWLPGTDLWAVKMDPSQIDQILANLCVNARDAIAGVGKVTIETVNNVIDAAYCTDHAGFIPGEYVLMAVSDNGCGMGNEILNNIFEPFFTTKDVGKGTGLGLATVYGIVKQNNGFINVYSEPGKGTTIKIYLPRHEGEAAKNPGKSTVEIPSGLGETILVVEDDLSVLKLAHKILDELGYTVLTAPTPREALEQAEEHAGKIHLLVTDVIMPEMNGHELAKRLKFLCPELKCVFMSGYTRNAIAHLGVLDEGVNFVQKPFSKRDLAITVRKVLDEGNNFNAC